MDIIKIKNITERCYTNEDGTKVYNFILPFLKKGGDINVSFEGVDAVPSSFVNTAFIQLLNDFSFEDVKKHLTFSNTSRQINEIIKSRFTFEAARKLADSN
jgi:hypothetical protein